MALTSQITTSLLQVDGRMTEGGVIEIVPGARLLLDVGVEDIEPGALLDEIATAVAEAQAARDEAVDISGISTSDAVIASRITTPGTATEAALSATIAAVADPIEATAESANTKATALQGLVLGGYSYDPAPTSGMLAFLGAAGHGWAVSGAGSGLASSNLNDTSDFMLGSQSASITTDGTSGGGGFPYLDKSGIPSFNFTGKFPRLWLKISDVSKVNPISLLLGTGTSNYYKFDFLASTGRNDDFQHPIPSNEWYVFDLPWTPTTTVGAPSRSGVTWARVLLNDRASGPVTVRLGGIGAVAETTDPKLSNGAVVLTFDDSYAGQYTVARPYMDKYGYTGTLLPIISAIGTAGCWTLAQGKAMQEAGWDFGAHATTGPQHALGLTGIYAAGGEAAVRTELEAIKSFMRANNLRGDSFGYPQNFTSTAVARILADYFRSGRHIGTANLPESWPIRQPYRIRGYSAHSSRPLSEMTGHVDRVKASKGIGVFTFHDIVASSATGNSVTTANFQALVDYINAQGVTVLTLSEAVAAAAAA